MQNFPAAKNILSSAQKIIIISHKSPDGDTIGSNLALRRALKYQWNKEIMSVCIDPLPEYCGFLPEASGFVRDFDKKWTDLIVTVDASADYMLGMKDSRPDLLAGDIPVLNFDHHASNNNFGVVNVVDPEAASTTQILYRFLKYAGFEIDRHIATCLLCGLYFDTGSFMHSNTTPEVLETASQLLWRGGDFKTIAQKQFRTHSIPQLKLYGRIMERAYVNSKKMAVSTVTQKDFEETGAASADTTGAVDFLNSIPDGNFCCLLYEDRKGLLKGSFRTRENDINLSQLAGMFGGGGHKKASGFSIPAKLHKIDSEIKIEKP